MQKDRSAWLPKSLLTSIACVLLCSSTTFAIERRFAEDNIRELVVPETGGKLIPIRHVMRYARLIHRNVHSYLQHEHLYPLSCRFYDRSVPCAEHAYASGYDLLRNGCVESDRDCPFVLKFRTSEAAQSSGVAYCKLERMPNHSLRIEKCDIATLETNGDRWSRTAIGTPSGIELGGGRVDLECRIPIAMYSGGKPTPQELPQLRRILEREPFLLDVYQGDGGFLATRDYQPSKIFAGYREYVTIDVGSTTPFGTLSFKTTLLISRQNVDRSACHDVSDVQEAAYLDRIIRGLKSELGPAISCTKD
jgi:hypothetical protein